MNRSGVRHAGLAYAAYTIPRPLAGPVRQTGPYGAVRVEGVTFDVVAVRDNRSSGFQGTVFKQQGRGQFVVALRGTEPHELVDLAADLKMVVHRVNAQASDAARLVEEAKLRMQQWSEENPQSGEPELTVTGHSLGGTLAQLMAARHGLRGETFNAYGAAGLLHGVPEGGHQVINHVLATDAVSAASPHFGEVRVYALAEELAVLESPLGGYGGKPGQPGNPLLTAMAAGDAVHGIHLFSRLPRGDGKPDAYMVVQDPQALLHAARHAEQIHAYRQEMARQCDELAALAAMQGELEVREDEDMTLTQAIVGLALATTLASGCSSGHPDDIDSYAAKGAYIRSLPEEPKAYRRNPKPQQAYELTVTLENAPGPMVLMGGAAGYEARDCSYLVNRFAGATAQPQDSEEIHFTQVDAATWRGTFFADAMLDEDYDGPQGTMLPCRWTLMRSGVRFSATGAQGETIFDASIALADEALADTRSQVTWYTVYGYPGESFLSDGDSFQNLGRSDRPALPDADLFRITLTTRMLAP